MHEWVELKGVHLNYICKGMARTPTCYCLCTTAMKNSQKTTKHEKCYRCCLHDTTLSPGSKVSFGYCTVPTTLQVVFFKFVCFQLTFYHHPYIDRTTVPSDYYTDYHYNAQLKNFSKCNT